MFEIVGWGTTGGCRCGKTSVCIVQNKYNFDYWESCDDCLPDEVVDKVLEAFSYAFASYN